MTAQDIPGRLAARVVGILDLLIDLIDLGMYIRLLVMASRSFGHLPGSTVAMLTVYGIYIGLVFVAVFLLIYATFSHASVRIRFYISAGWIVFRGAWYVAYIVLFVYGRFWLDSAVLGLSIWWMIMWVIFVALVCYYAYGLFMFLEEENKVGPSTQMNGVGNTALNSAQYPRQAWNSEKY